MRRSAAILLLFLILLAGTTFTSNVQAQTSDSSAVVRAVLFYSPTCPHCHIVQSDVLPPLQEQYGEQLVILEIDASQPVGQQIYRNYLEAFNIGDNRVGVPALVVGDTVLVGSQEIPNQFPGIIEAGLGRGGIDWPEIPALDLVADLDQQQSNAPPSGIGLAWIVFIGMLLAAVVTVWIITQIDWQAFPGVIELPLWPIPLLSLIGIGVSGYMAYVDVTLTEAVCGPIGDCNAVQTSSYAQIMGIPVAVLGIIFYLAVALIWLFLPRVSDVGRRRLAGGALLGLTAAGTLFSIYLTALEIFVIEAVCAWCLTSAIISTGLMLLVAFGMLGSSREARRTARGRRRRMAH